MTDLELTVTHVQTYSKILDQGIHYVLVVQIVPLVRELHLGTHAEQSVGYQIHEEVPCLWREWAEQQWEEEVAENVIQSLVENDGVSGEMVRCGDVVDGSQPGIYRIDIPWYTSEESPCGGKRQSGEPKNRYGRNPIHPWIPIYNFVQIFLGQVLREARDEWKECIAE